MQPTPSLRNWIRGNWIERIRPEGENRRQKPRSAVHLPGFGGISIPSVLLVQIETYASNFWGGDCCVLKNKSLSESLLGGSGRLPIRTRELSADKQQVVWFLIAVKPTNSGALRMELLSRFELETSSLPRMRSTN